MIDKALIRKCEAYMLECLKGDMAHDPHHIYRVLNLAMDITRHEHPVDRNILIISCLLHDIGRKAQHEDPALCHAEVGGQMAYEFLIGEGADERTAQAVKAAIRSHRYRSRHTPETIEAKILFDADTIDVTGAMGIARSLQYEGHGTIPIYNVDADGCFIHGSIQQPDSFLREYEFKLRNVYDRCYTRRGREIAESRRGIARQFYEALEAEIRASHTTLSAIIGEL